MDEGLFAILLVFILLLFIFNNNIANFTNKTLHNNDISFNFQKVYISYLAFIILSLVLIIGMASGTKTKQKFKNVSSGFEKARTKDDDRPHPMFDIDTYW